MALFDLEEILVVVNIRHVVKAQITRTILREQELFGGSNLIEELSQELVLLEAFRYLVAFYWEAFITAVCELLNNATLVHFDDLDWLLSVVDRAYSSSIELALESSLFLFDHLMGQLD